MDWSEWWSRHSETVWATVAALIIAVAVGYYFWLKAEKPKHLGWEVLTSDRIIQVDEAQLRPQQLKMTFDDIEVKQPNLTIVRVGNSGKKEIRAADFDGDVDITFNEATLKTCTAARWSDDRMIPTLTTYDYIASRVSLSPLLLNPGDWIDIQCVTDGPLETPSITARIAGQTKSISSVVKRTKSKRRKFWEGWLNLGAMVIVLAVCYEYLVFHSGLVIFASASGVLIAMLLPFTVGSYFGTIVKQPKGGYSPVWKEGT